ncbi:uncharacterized protein TRIVIDRAFT_213331 [Trichoderma virens Gv29-8]|uniref:Uncharacterized protein n=1 Tax=Hypocrea virens (strain Gv29-8 / FGSC 10586) TaxID=413071 RepID=G9MY09_HYPVG|nr:uncharacterized protein TRIVIDRAFT_213331 [Trichoderma virens Gv29-8]EHK20769.1 hypothetical protein TRIVIDRAFT_213331 [Trichoderma virens Gv29-8]
MSTRLAYMMKPVLASANIASVARTLHPTKMRSISTTLNVWRTHRKYQIITNYQHLIRNFSSYSHLRNKQNNEDLPSFSFEGLGMTRNVKLFVIAVLSIFGTIETWVWCKGIYRWWNGPSEKEKKLA